MEQCYTVCGKRETVLFLDRLKELGFRYATLSGISLCMADITIPGDKEKIIAAAEQEVSRIEAEYARRTLTDEERHNMIVDVWMKASADVSARMMEDFGVPADCDLSREEKEDMKEFNSLFMMADSGARGSAEQISQVAGMRGLMAKPTGEIVEMPIRSNFKEGLTYHEYLLACHGARKGRADGAHKTANAGYFTRRLVDAAHGIVIMAEACDCLRGLHIQALTDNDEVVVPLAQRIAGRVSLRNVVDPDTGEILAAADRLISPEMAAAIESRGISRVEIRSPATCSLEEGICGRCYGLDLSTRELPVIGDAVGIVAAQSIGEPGTQLTLRTFHSGGKAAGAGLKYSVAAPMDGTVTMEGVRTVRNRDGRTVVVSRGGRLQLQAGRIRKDVGGIPYGAVGRGSAFDVCKGEEIISWDPYNMPIIAETGGTAEYRDFDEGVTVRSEIDPESGLSQLFVSAVMKDSIPRVMIGGREYFLPVGAIVAVTEGQEVAEGDVIARVPRKAAKSSDITGGLARVLQVLEARRSKSQALLSDIDGVVTVSPPQGKTVVIEIKGEGGKTCRYQVAADRQLNVYTGDRVRSGDILAEGPVHPDDVLRIKGRFAAALFIVDEVQKVYRSQGVEIADKHLEIIARKMLEKVEVTVGGATLTAGEILSRDRFRAEQRQAGNSRAVARPIVISLTKVGQRAESWLSAASYQNTSTVLARAAVRQAVDPLAATKENIILGTMVPVGTGCRVYRDTLLKGVDEVPAYEEPPIGKRKKIERFIALFDEE